MTTCDDMFAHYQDHWTDDGSNMYNGWRWWFDGTDPLGGSAEVNVPGGGAFWTSLPSWGDFDDYYMGSSTSSTLLSTIEDYLRQGYGVGLGISQGGATGHAITCWGVNYDSNYPTSDHRRYEGVWVSDSDNTFNVRIDPRKCKNKLKYYTVEYSDDHDRWNIDYLGKLSKGWYIKKVYGLAAGPGIPPQVNAGLLQIVYEGDTVLFDGSYESPGPALSSDAFTWYFGDHFDPSGNQATGSSTSHTYSKAGFYIVQLIVEDHQGDMGVDTLWVIVLAVDGTPTAAFEWSPDPPEEGSVIQFTDLSTSPADTIIAWHWTLGDGTTSTVQNPQHQYTDNGTYTVTLTVTDDDGSTDTITRTVTVLDGSPTAAFEWSPEPPEEGSLIQFTGFSTSPADAIVAWHWAFGDGANSTAQNPQHQYADNGTYTVTLTVTDDDGSSGTLAILLTVDNVAPTLTLSAPSDVPEGALHTLMLASYDPGNDTISSWTIDWGDGLVEVVLGNPSTVTHVYADGPSSYTITATATDEDGTWEAANSLAVAILNVAPTVWITSVAQAQPFTLTELLVLMRDPLVATSGATDPGADDLTFTWSWGDGAENVTAYLNEPPTYPVAIEESLEHTYMEPGEYFLTLTVADDDGGIGAVTVTVTVWGPRNLKTNVITELEALKTGERCIDRRLERVIWCIEGSLYQELWLDATHLDPYWGWCVFLYEHLAEVHLELRTELYEHLIPVLEEWIECWQAKGCDTTWLEAKLARMQALLPVFEAALFKLAKADELLVRVAIADAENTPVQNAKWQHKVDSFLLNANQHLRNASTYLEMEQFGTAICHYKVAWKFAQKAMTWATKSGSSS
ncbi:MAG: PKD domain-containing protein [Candidatus Hodarchaeales archaeon]|jgi:PKD repeat protein